MARDREGGRKGGREEWRERGREGWREGGREGRMEGDREGGRAGGEGREGEELCKGVVGIHSKDKYSYSSIENNCQLCIITTHTDH